MFRNCILILLVILAFAQVTQAADAPTIVPQPKSMNMSGGSLELANVAIVIGSKATEPEQYAAERLRDFVNKRFGQEWPVVKDSVSLKSYGALIVLGQQSTNKLIDDVCSDLKIDPAEKYPIPDGYMLGVGKSDGKTVAVVAGSNPRSVIFGQDTLFQLLAKDGDGINVRRVTIKDWPSMPHRGRVCTSPSSRSLDSIALGRLNFIDIRYGTYGTPAGYAIEHDMIKEIIKEAHKRGLIVYGTVSLAVQKPNYDKVMATFQEFIDLGVDGLWPYLGDPGGEGRSGTPLELLARVIDLGKKHGMTGDLIHYTPGKIGYRTIATNDNFAAAKVPGMADALWFFAVKPDAQACADAAKLGLHKKYIWWNHWPHPRGGFTSCGNVNRRDDGKSHIYADITPFQDAYQDPTPGELALVPLYADGAIPWGGTIWLPETVVAPFGWWAWSPETDNARQTRLRVYDYIYGPEMVATAVEFNDMLEQAKSKIIRCGDDTGTPGYKWPPLLWDESLRPECRELLGKLQAPLDKLRAAGASRGSMLDAQTLEEYFFEPMYAELAAGKIVIDLPHPEYWWESHLTRIKIAMREGNCVQALRWQADAKARIEDDMNQIKERTANVIKMERYESDWMRLFDKLAGDATYTSSSIKIDGNLNEPAWATAQELAPFRIYNDSQITPSLSVARVLYTDDALYVGLTFGEPNMDLIIGNYTEHDSPVWEEDSFEVLINADGLGTPYYKFLANTLGTKCEAMFVAGNREERSWDGNWDVKVVKNPDGWGAELKIPYATLGVSKPEKDTMWLCNFARNDRASEIRGTTRGENWIESTAWGYSPRGYLNDPRKLWPIWFK